MQMKHFIITLSIWLWLVLPLQLISFPVIAVLLLTKWDGRTTWFGNVKHGRATEHFSHATKGNYWLELNWLWWRNPVYNFASKTLAAPMQDYDHWGDDPIGDKIAGGFYKIRMGKFWEYYWIKPYTIFGLKRCIRVRVGWKINDNLDATAMFVFSINPWKEYVGV